jgi:hypothetical protein
MKYAVLAFVASVFIGAFACGGSDEPAAARAPEIDATAQLTCDDYRKLVNDAKAGVITDTEIRPRVTAIFERGRYSAEPSIAQASTRLMRAISRDVDDFTASSDAMTAACTDIVWSRQ